GKALRDNVLAAAASILQADPKKLDIRSGVVVDGDTGRERMGLDEVARVVYFRPDTLPPGFQAEFMVTRHYVPRQWPFAFTNGVQTSYVEVDIRTGEVRLLKHWCVEDCGTVINPQLVDEQIRGGIVQGIGGVLYENCLYDADGQMLNATLMDYLVPMAGEMPDIEVGHVVTPTADSELGTKGAGEAGTAGAPACIMNAINDALHPLGAAPITQMPITPERVLAALRRA
ncbi:MAG: molybdopterin cofactor-binding domain-containing protein, partial [Xanthobacteraceae bacterium]